MNAADEAEQTLGPVQRVDRVRATPSKPTTPHPTSLPARANARAPRGRPPEDPRERLARKSDLGCLPDGGTFQTACQLYKSQHRDRVGYGREWWQGREVRAHVLSFLLSRGLDELPEGYEVHHRCRNRACVEITHLELMKRDEHRCLRAPVCRACSSPYPPNCKEDSRGHRGCPTCAERRRLSRRARRTGSGRTQLSPRLSASDLATGFRDAVRGWYPDAFFKAGALDDEAVMIQREWLADLGYEETAAVLLAAARGEDEWCDLLGELHRVGAIGLAYGDFQAPPHPRIRFLTGHMEAVVEWHRARIREEGRTARKRLRAQMRQLADVDVPAEIDSSRPDNVVDVCERVWRAQAAREGLEPAAGLPEEGAGLERFVRRFRVPQRRQLGRLATLLAERYPDPRLLPTLLSEVAANWPRFAAYARGRVAPLPSCWSSEARSAPPRADIDYLLRHADLAIDWCALQGSPGAQDLARLVQYPTVPGTGSLSMDELVGEARTLQDLERVWIEAQRRAETGCALSWTHAEKRQVGRWVRRVDGTPRERHRLAAVLLAACVVSWPDFAVSAGPGNASEERASQWKPCVRLVCSAEPGSIIRVLERERSIAERLSVLDDWEEGLDDHPQEAVAALH